MKISIALENGYLPAKYSKFADEKNRYKNQPITSFPIIVSEIPAGAKFLSLSLVDYEAIPVCGFPWIHWTVANIPVTSNHVEIPENFSRIADKQIIQGKNSFASPFIGESDTNITQRYVGPTPPDKDHRYLLSVTAWKERLNLDEGFWWNELLSKNPENLAEVTLSFLGKK